MARTFLRPDAQIRNSVVYDDSLASGATLETQTTIEGDLNALRSQVNRIIGETNWYDALSNRSLASVDDDLASVEGKTVLGRVSLLTDITVASGANYHILSVAGSEAPSLVIGIGAYSDPAQAVAVVAQSALSGAGFAAHELTEVAGFNALSPKNLCIVVDAATGQPVQSDVGSGVMRDVYALLQAEFTAANGDAFDDVSGGSRGKLSFVRVNSAGNDLEACPVADIEGKTVNYAYVRRAELVGLPEDIALGGSFVDQAASVDVTLQNAYSNGATISTSGGVDIAFTLASGDFVVEGGGAVSFGASSAVASFDVDASGSVSLNSTGAAIAIGDGANNFAIDIGTAGDRAISMGVQGGSSSLALAAGSGGASMDSDADIALNAAVDIHLASSGGIIDFDDQYRGASSYTGPVPLASSSAEWSAFEGAFGDGASLLDAIVQAKTATSRAKYVAVVTANVAADANVTGAGMSANLDAALGDYSTVDFVADVDVFVNGQLMRNGADASANHDVYPGTSASNGDLKFEFALVATPGSPDVITMVIHGA
ncbi:MAG: hypothetical protein KGS10_05455 [Chloroflexi bacterium]|nr:hypothetical protein [Chloroflexota bacterium]